MIAGALGLAVLASGAQATASVLQRKAARDEPASQSFSLGMLWDLAHRGTWIGGILAVLLGFGLQAAALGSGPISLVQPVLVLELPWTLLLAWPMLGGRPRRQEWISVGVMAAGVALLLFALTPTGGNPTTASLARWLTGIAVTLGLVLALSVAGQHRRGPVRAALVGIAAGIGFGFTAVLVKTMTAAFAAGGMSSVFASWQTYLVIAVGPGSFFLLQNALAAGSLVASQPALTLLNPVTAVAWGLTILGEHVRGGGWLVLAFTGVALIAVGTISLARSPLFHQRGGQRKSDPTRATPR